MTNHKLAIVVGHNAQAQGAQRGDNGESEYMFNSRIARLMEEYARAKYPDLDVRVFFRQPMGSYTNEIRRVYDQVDAWAAHLSMELHFNASESPSASGTETLTSGTPASMAAAVAVNDEVVRALGLRDRGVKTRSKGRGSASLIFGRAPAILVEPFFGSSTKGLTATDEASEEKVLAMAYIIGAANALGVMPRQDIQLSRTMKDAGTATTLSKVGKSSDITALLSTVANNTQLKEILAQGQAFGIGEWLPYIAAGSICLSLAIHFGIPMLQENIIKYRKEDHKKYNGS